MELIHYLAENGNTVLKQHLSTAPRNATYLGHRSQNEMITIIGNSIKAEILRQVREAKIFCFMVDETRDLAHLDQLIIVAGYMKKGATVIQERLIGLLNVHEKTGKALENIVLSFLTENNLSVSNSGPMLRWRFKFSKPEFKDLIQSLCSFTVLLTV